MRVQSIIFNQPIAVFRINNMNIARLEFAKFKASVVTAYM